MPYSECCGAFSHMAPEIDICPECKEHTDWVYDEDIENEHIDKEETDTERNTVRYFPELEDLTLLLSGWDGKTSFTVNGILLDKKY